MVNISFLWAIHSLCNYCCLEFVARKYVRMLLYLTHHKMDLVQIRHLFCILILVHIWHLFYILLFYILIDFQSTCSISYWVMIVVGPAIIVDFFFKFYQLLFHIIWKSVIRCINVHNCYIFLMNYPFIIKKNRLYPW